MEYTVRMGDAIDANTRFTHHTWLYLRSSFHLEGLTIGDFFQTRKILLSISSKMLSFSSLKPSLPCKPSLITPCFHQCLPSMNLKFDETTRISLSHRVLQINALGAMPPFDHGAEVNNLECKINSRSDNTKLKIAIVGFGKFGQFLAKTLVRQGHSVLAHSRSDYSELARSLGVLFFSDADDLCEEHPDVVIFSTSILSIEAVLKSFPVQRLKRSTLFVDVLSVKELPRSLFIDHLPGEYDILCTHPMFGPESGRNGWKGLNFVFDRVRIGPQESRIRRCDTFLDIFAQEGCNMVEMTCAEHDRHAAESQFMTHTVGRVLERLGLLPLPINTKGYEALLGLIDNTVGDSFELYYGLFMYNKTALEQLERLEMAFMAMKRELFQRIRDAVRRQFFGTVEDARRGYEERQKLFESLSDAEKRRYKQKLFRIVDDSDREKGGNEKPEQKEEENSENAETPGKEEGGENGKGNEEK